MKKLLCTLLASASLCAFGAGLPTFTGTFAGNALSLTNLNAGALMASVADTNLLFVSGLTASWIPAIGESGAAPFDATAGNGTYYWSQTQHTYTNGSWGWVPASVSCYGVALLTNGTYHDQGNCDYVAANSTGDTSFFGQFIGVVQNANSDDSPTALSAVITKGVNLVSVSNATTVHIGASVPVELNGNLAGMINGEPTTSFSGTNILVGSLPVSRLVKFGITETNFDNNTLLNYESGNFAAYAGLNRFGTSNTFYALKNHKVVTMLLDGGGLLSPNSSQGLLDQVYFNLTNFLPVAGYITAAAAYPSVSVCPISYVGTGSYGNGGASPSGVDANWFGQYVKLTNSGSTATFSLNNGFAANVFEVDYLTTAASGKFAIGTNNGSGLSWMITNNAFGASHAGALFRWTNTTPSPMSIMVSNEQSGTIFLVGLVWINNTITNGVVVGLQSAQGQGITALNQPGTAVKAPIYASWNPTLILFNEITTVGDYVPGLQILGDFYRTNTPNADVVLCGTYAMPLPPNDTGLICDEVNNLADIGIMRAVAYTNSNFVFFDGHTPMPDNAQFASRGLLGGAFSPHASAAGYQFYGNLVWRFLALQERH